MVPLTTIDKHQSIHHETLGLIVPHGTTRSAVKRRKEKKKTNCSYVAGDGSSQSKTEQFLVVFLHGTVPAVAPHEVIPMVIPMGNMWEIYGTYRKYMEIYKTWIGMEVISE